MPNGEILNPSLIEAKYHCRELQAQAILEKAIAEKQAKDGGGDESSKLLTLALRTPPVYFEDMLRKMGINKGELIKRTASAIIAGVKQEKTIAILSQLFQACKSDYRWTSEVAIDVADDVLPDPLQSIFPQNLPALREILSQGSEQAMLNILRHVQGNVPLLRYRKGLIKNKIALSSVTNGGEVGSLPSVIPNVDLRFYYPRNQQNPILSFVVNPF